MVEMILKKWRQDPLFNIDIMEASSKDNSIIFTLEVPRGLIDLKDGTKLEVNITSKEEEGDLVMKGVVNKVDPEKKAAEISFFGLWMRLKYKKSIPFELNEGDEVYLSIKAI